MSEVDLDQLSFVTDSSDVDPTQPGAGRTVDRLLTVGSGWLNRRLDKIPGVRAPRDEPTRANGRGVKDRPANWDRLSFVSESDAATASSHAIGHGRTLGRLLSKLAPHLERWIALVVIHSGREPNVQVRKSIVPESAKNHPHCRWCAQAIGALPELPTLHEIMHAWLFSHSFDDDRCRMNYITALLRDERFPAACKALVRNIRKNRNTTSRLMSIQLLTLLVAFDPTFRTLFTSLGAVDALNRTLKGLILPGQRRQILLIPSRRALACLTDAESLGSIKELDRITHASDSRSVETVQDPDATLLAVQRLMQNLVGQISDDTYQIVIVRYMSAWFAGPTLSHSLWAYSAIANVFRRESLYRIWLALAHSDDPVHQTIITCGLRCLYGYKPSWYLYRNQTQDFGQHFWNIWMWPVFQLRANFPVQYSQIPMELLQFIIEQWILAGYPGPTPGILATGLLGSLHSCVGDPLTALRDRVLDPTFGQISLFRRAIAMRQTTIIQRMVASSNEYKLLKIMLSSLDDDASVQNFKSALELSNCTSYRMLSLLQHPRLRMQPRASIILQWLLPHVSNFTNKDKTPQCIGIVSILPSDLSRSLPEVFDTHLDRNIRTPPARSTLRLVSYDKDPPCVWVPFARSRYAGPMVHLERPSASGSGSQCYHIGCLRSTTMELEDRGRLILLDDQFRPLDAKWSPLFRHATYGLHVLAAFSADASLFWTSDGSLLTHAVKPNIKQTCSNAMAKCWDCRTV